jgi:hypothetical protein
LAAPKLGDRHPGAALHPWSGVVLLTLLAGCALLLAATAASQPLLWLMMGAIAGFAVSGST